MINQGDIKKMRKELKFYDFTGFPRHFKNPHDCIDYYNDMCYQAEVQWQFGHVQNGSKESFVIECPFSKMCPVRVKFNWNKSKGYFSRETTFAIFHDHCVQRIDLSDVDPETLEEARMLVRQSNKKITASELAEQCRLKPYQATMVIKTTMLTEFYELPDEMSTQSIMAPQQSEQSQLSTISTSSVQTSFSRTMSLLVADLQHLKDAMPLTTAIYNTKGDEQMAFIQTGDMLELYKRNHESGVLINLCLHVDFPSKYGMNMLYFSGVDQELGNILTFGIGLFSQKSSIAMWWILSKFLDKCVLVKKPLRLVFAPLDTKLFKLLSRELPFQCRLYATQHSVIEKVRDICQLGTAPAISQKVLKLMMDLCLTDTEEAARDKLNEIKYILQAHPEAYSKFIKHVYNLKKAWLLTEFKDVFNGGLHSFNRAGIIVRKLSEPLPLEKDDEETKEDTMYMRRDQHKDSSWSTEASMLGNQIKDTSLSINDLLKHVQAFEEINETFYFKFEKGDGLDNLTNGAQYICAKKAFTPFGAMHMLKQIHLADMYRDQVKLEEHKPLVDYTLKFKNLSPIEGGPDFSDSVYKLTASSASKGLKELKCSCAFYTNYQMICWHAFHLLEKLQIKNMGGFEHLRKWREYVGFKSLNLNDKRVTQTYKVQKNRRLKSFIEEVTKKHKKRLEQVCKEKGIELKTKRIGEQVSSGEENEWEEINSIVKKREEQARQRRRQIAKDKRNLNKQHLLKTREKKQTEKTERKVRTQERKAAKKVAKEKKREQKKRDKKAKKDKTRMQTRKRFRDEDNSDNDKDPSGGAQKDASSSSGSSSSSSQSSSQPSQAPKQSVPPAKAQQPSEQPRKSTNHNQKNMDSDSDSSSDSSSSSKEKKKEDARPSIKAKPKRAAKKPKNQKDKNEEKKGSSSSSGTSSDKDAKPKKKAPVKRKPAQPRKKKVSSKSSSSGSSSSSSSSSDSSSGSGSSSSSSSTSSSEEKMNRVKKTKNVLGIGKKINNEENDGEFFLGGKKAIEIQERKAKEAARRTRRKTLKEIDADEYEDEIWLAYVEPQYENEYSKMLVAQNRLLAPKADDDAKIQQQRDYIKKQMETLNQNTDVPQPKTIMIKKVAINLAEFDEVRENWRTEGKEVFDLDEPASPVNLQCIAQEFPAYYYSGAHSIARRGTGPKKRHRQYKCNEFVDTTKVIIGSSQEQDSERGCKIINSQEENNIITSKPIVRGPRKKANYEEVAKILEYNFDSDDSDRKRKTKRGRKLKAKEESDGEIPVKSQSSLKHKRKDKGERKGKKFRKENDDENYNVNKDLYEKAKPVEVKKREKKEILKNNVKMKHEKQLDQLLKESIQEQLDIGKFVDSKRESSNSLKSKYDQTQAKTEDIPVNQDDKQKSHKKSISRKTKEKVKVSDDAKAIKESAVIAKVETQKQSAEVVPDAEMQQAIAAVTTEINNKDKTVALEIRVKKPAEPEITKKVEKTRAVQPEINKKTAKSIAFSDVVKKPVQETISKKPSTNKQDKKELKQTAPKKKRGVSSESMNSSKSDELSEEKADLSNSLATESSKDKKKTFDANHDASKSKQRKDVKQKRQDSEEEERGMKKQKAKQTDYDEKPQKQPAQKSKKLDYSDSVSLKKKAKQITKRDESDSEEKPAKTKKETLAKSKKRVTSSDSDQSPKNKKVARNRDSSDDRYDHRNDKKKNYKDVRKDSDEEKLFGLKIKKGKKSPEIKTPVKSQSKHHSVKRVETIPGKKSAGKSTSISQMKTCDATDDRNISKDECSLDESPKKKSVFKQKLKEIVRDESSDIHHHRRPKSPKRKEKRDHKLDQKHRRERSRDTSPVKSKKRVRQLSSNSLQ